MLGFHGSMMHASSVFTFFGVAEQRARWTETKQAASSTMTYRYESRMITGLPGIHLNVRRLPTRLADNQPSVHAVLDERSHDMGLAEALDLLRPISGYNDRPHTR